MFNSMSSHFDLILCDLLIKLAYWAREMCAALTHAWYRAQPNSEPCFDDSLIRQHGLSGSFDNIIDSDPKADKAWVLVNISVL